MYKRLPSFGKILKRFIYIFIVFKRDHFVNQFVALRTPALYYIDQINIFALEQWISTFNKTGIALKFCSNTDASAILSHWP